MKKELLDMLVKAWPPATVEDVMALPPEILVVDCETTGLQARMCGLLEIAVIHPASGDSWDVMVNPGECLVEPKALEKNGYTRAMMHTADRIGVWDALPLMTAWCRSKLPEGRALMCGRNPSFDMRFLDAAAATLGSEADREAYAELWSHQLVDTHGGTIPWAIGKRVPLSEGLRYAYRSLQVADEPKPHRAVRGVVQALAGLLALVQESRMASRRAAA